MRLPTLLAACILVIPAFTSAQNSAADGVQAFVRGDNQDAIRILTPLAEDRPDADPVAAFFLALAYQSSPGWSGSSRACGLFMKAATSTSPVAAQAQVLATALQMESDLMRTQCTLASVRGWGQPAWTTFTLAPGHTVRIDSSGFSVDYEQTSRSTGEGWGGAGWQFLPIRLTELATSLSGQGRRYFIELFAWTPHTPDDSTQWSLVWFAYEVVGADVISVPGNGGVVTVFGSAPPESFPIGDFARFLVADGEVQRVILGPNGRRVSIPDGSSR